MADNCGYDERELVTIARDAFSSSSTYFDANVRDRIIDDIRQFQSLHPEGSKYHTDSYRLKSKLFRPKTRSAIRKNEAVAANAFFATEDVVAVRPMDDDEPLQVAGADVHKALLQYRLTKPYPHGIPWFLTCCGAYQEAQTVGIVSSFQEWEYDEDSGVDKPDIKLLPVENVRFDPAADWRDVVNSSPYIIVMWPMYLRDVKRRMVRKVEAVERIDHEDGTFEDVPVMIETNEGCPWRYYADGDLLAESKYSNDTIRAQREKDRTDSKDANTAANEFTIVWVHQNFVNIDGRDVMYYTLGDSKLLSDPIPTRDRYPQGRPVVCGFSILEAHTTYPSSTPSITRDIQTEVNDIANLRIDNIKLILNKRHIVKRNAQVDLRSLTRNIPSSVTLTNDMSAVKFVTTDDATGSSYQEQDRLNLDYDDLSGAFSGSSVASNRKLNETVGGMNILNSQSNMVSEYQLRTFVETWVEPVLRQIVVLEQAYEDDELVLRLAGKHAKIDQHGFDSITEEMISQNTIVNVAVGTGATNPQTKVERFVFGLKSLSSVMPKMLARLKDEEVVKELFGNLGYKDGLRFFDMGDEDEQDPRLIEAMQLIQKLQQELEAKHPAAVVAAQVEKTQAEAKRAEADTNLKNVQAMVKRIEGLFSAMNTAQTAVQTPGVAPVADEIAASAGFDDQNAGTIYPQEIPYQEIPEEYEIEQNTSPNFPANPSVGMNRGMEAGVFNG